MGTKVLRMRPEAFSGHGYGTLRYNLFRQAKKRIERSIKEGYYCEAIAIIESVITDRLESQLSYLKQKTLAF